MYKEFLNHIHVRSGGCINFPYFMRWTDLEQEITTFPLWTVNGQLVGYQQYDWSASKLRNNNSKGKYFTYRNKNILTVYGLEYIDNLHTIAKLYVTEGIFDAISVRNTGRACVAVLSNNPKQLRNWFSSLSCKVIAVCEGDKAGRMLANNCDSAIFLPEGEDANSMNLAELDLILRSSE